MAILQGKETCILESKILPKIFRRKNTELPNLVWFFLSFFCWSMCRHLYIGIRKQINLITVHASCNSTYSTWLRGLSFSGGTNFVKLFVYVNFIGEWLLILCNSCHSFFFFLWGDNNKMIRSAQQLEKMWLEFFPDDFISN